MSTSFLFHSSSRAAARKVLTNKSYNTNNNFAFLSGFHHRRPASFFFSTLLDPDYADDDDDEKVLVLHDNDNDNNNKINGGATMMDRRRRPLPYVPPSMMTPSPVNKNDPEVNSVRSTSKTTTTSDSITISREKSGSPSPWAVFDAWGASANVWDDDDQRMVLSPDDEIALSDESVVIPMTDSDRETVPDETDILDSYERYLQSKSSFHLGYPYNLVYDTSELHNFMNYSINNLGDPFVPSNYGVHSRQFECSVIDFFAKLWKMQPDSYWGYVTTSGTEGNLHGILLARENHPDGILYTSNETHYSVFKAARYYRMDCRSIPTLPMGEIDYDLLAKELDKNRDFPAIINVNIGTTVKGAVDDLDRILQILKELEIPRDMYHIHCDGALFALMMPFIDNAPEISFEKPIDSIAVSGHKMLGCPMPCGIALCRKEHVEKVEQHIDYLNSVDTTIMGSRNGQAALYMWYSLRKKGLAGIKRDVMHCVDTAKYLLDELTNAGFSCRLNDLSSTVVLERPNSDDFVQRWQLACEEDIAHVVVMPNVTMSKIDAFVEELCELTKKFGRIEAHHPESPLSKLATEWGRHRPSDIMTRLVESQVLR